MKVILCTQTEVYNYTKYNFVTNDLPDGVRTPELFYTSPRF